MHLSQKPVDKTPRSDTMEFDEGLISEGLKQTLVIAQERARILERLKQALLAGDNEKIKHYASQICGLNNESNRISKGIDTGTRG